MEGSMRRGNRISLAIRFLGLLKQPESDSSAGLELDERDVVWCGDFSSDDTSNTRASTKDSFLSAIKGTDSHPSSPVSPLLPVSSGNRRRVHAFDPGLSGLSAALANENRSFVQRKASVDPKRVSDYDRPPSVPLSRTSSGNGDFSAGRKGGSPGQLPQSAPVNVPDWSKASRMLRKMPNFAEEEEGMSEERLPPHEMVARDLARSHNTAFSVLEGAGRTLKGRDLRQVRNAIFRQTGFLE